MPLTYTTITCPQCDGTRWITDSRGTSVLCPMCDGTGRAPVITGRDSRQPTTRDWILAAVMLAAFAAACAWLILHGTGPG